MLGTEENAELTQVGKGTVMGALMREYWLPAMLSSELPGPDTDPVRVLLLGEQLVAFRDTNGRVGLLEESCPHRGGALFYGRNEACGLRCIYHGWKFDVTGRCVDMPNEPSESNFKDRIRAVAYPTEERGGVIWAYLGPRSTPPPLPDLEANVEGASAIAVLRECNWLQALEGDIDTSHFSFLHIGAQEPEDLPEESFLRSTAEHRNPRYAVLDTPHGATYAAYRPFAPGKVYWRVANFSFPFYTQPGPGTLGAKVNIRAWVPMDDVHTMFFMMTGPGEGRQAGFGGIPGGAPEKDDITYGTGWTDRFRLRANRGNDHLIDRDLQRHGQVFSGIRGIHTQDQAITEAMGQIYDRSKEHLGTSDVMVVRVRRRLLDAARAFAEKGTVPPGVDEPEVYRVRSGGVVLDEGVDWYSATEELRKAYVDHPELDRRHEP